MLTSITSVTARVALLATALSIGCHAGAPALFHAEDTATLHTLTSTLFTAVLSFTNVFAEPGQLLVFAGGRTHTPAGLAAQPYELWTAFGLTGAPQSTSYFFHDVLTNRVGFGMQSFSCADVLSISPGAQIVELLARVRVPPSHAVFVDNLALNALFIPDSGTSVSCMVVRLPSTSIYPATSVWQTVVVTNVNLQAGRYLLVGAAATANAVFGSRADAELRLELNTEIFPYADFQLPSVDLDGTDRSVVLHRGGDFNDVVVTNAALQIKVSTSRNQPVKLYRAMLALIHDQRWAEDWVIQGRPVGQTWYWSGGTTSLPPEVLNFDMPYDTLHLACSVVGTTEQQARCQVQLSHNDSTTGAPLRQDELAREFNLPQYVPGQFSLFHEAPMGSNRFTTVFGTAPPTPQTPLYRTEGWQCVIAIPVPEPMGMVCIALGAWLLHCRSRR
jgi:hypothetical protein